MIEKLKQQIAQCRKKKDQPAEESKTDIYRVECPFTQEKKKNENKEKFVLKVYPTEEIKDIDDLQISEESKHMLYQI